MVLVPLKLSQIHLKLKLNKKLLQALSLLQLMSHLFKLTLRCPRNITLRCLRYGLSNSIF